MIVLAILIGLAGSAWLTLQNSRVQTHLTRRLATHLSKKINAEISIGKVNVTFFNKVILEDLLIEDQQADTLIFVQSITAQIDTLKIKQKKLSFRKLTFENSRINTKRDSLNRFNFSFIIDSLKTRQSEPGEWQYHCSNFGLARASVAFTDMQQQGSDTLQINDFHVQISDFSFLHDSLFLTIEQLTFNDGKEFVINNFNSDFTISERRIVFNGLNLETGYSTVTDSRFQLNLPKDSGSFFNSAEIDFQFSHSQISFYEIAQLVPALRGMDQVVDCSGQIQGNLASLRGKNMELITGNKTRAVFDFYANDITRTETMFLFIDLHQSQTTFQDLSRIKLPGNGKNRFLRFHESLYQAGLITYRGNFTGFLTDFVAYGTLNSAMGRITTDLSVVPDERRNIAYSGEIATQNFRLGKFIKNDLIGNLSFKGRVNGSYETERQMVAGNFEGDISSVDINDYTYENIRLDGVLNNRLFDGLVVMNDSNLQFSFLGKLNFNPEVPVFDFRLDLHKAIPGNLNLIDKFPESELAFLMNANFSGDKLDNLIGTIDVERGFYRNRNGSLNLGGMELQSISSGLNNYLTFTSGYFDVEINGIYHFQNLADAFEKSMNRYLPALGFAPDGKQKINRFGFQVDMKNLDSITAVFAPELKIETPFLLYGQMDSEKSVFELKGSIPMVRTDKIMLRNIFIGNNPREDIYVSRFRVGELLLKNGIGIQNMTLNSEIFGNTIMTRIAWGEDELPDNQTQKKSYGGEILSKAVLNRVKNSSYPHIGIEGFPSQIRLYDSIWQVNPFTASIDSTTIRINDLIMSSNGQRIGISGEIAENDSSLLSLLFTNINLAYLKDYLNRDLPVEGKLEGSVMLQDYYNRRLLFSDLSIDRFTFRDQEIGTVSLNNRWNNEESALKSDLKIYTEERQNLSASGNYYPESREMLYHAEFDHLSLVILETMIRNNFSNFKGDGTGKLTIHGTPDRILMDGAIMGSNASLTIDYTRVNYNFSDSVFFRGDTIRFNRINIRDAAGNRGVLNGTIVQNNFQEMQYNLSISSPRITALNTTARENPRFFGKLVANGRLNITGRGRSVKLSGSATTLPGTSVNISLEDESVLQRYDFIQFVSTDYSERQEFLFSRRDDSDFSLDITITATPEARAQLIYNSQIGDVIRAQGEGILRFGMDREGNITLSGSYEVERGDYLFTLQNVINKRFTIEQGGTINWSGDPYNAIINISAIYKLKASLYDLLVNTYDNIYQSQRIPVDCKILLSDELSNPNINFAIEFPTVEDRLVEELRQFFNTPEEMNKQILSLVVLGKFYTPEYLRGTYEAQTPNLIGTTASELFSNQLSNWLSQISRNVDVGLNYRPGNQITNDEIELALSTQMFNDRVTINGNIGNNNNPNSINNSQLVGDFDLNVKLIPTGKIRLKAYNRSNNNLIYETAPYTQGVGVSFSEDFNNFNDLLKKMNTIFNRNGEQ